MVATLFGTDCPNCRLSDMTYSGNAMGTGTGFGAVPNTQGQSQVVAAPNASLASNERTPPTNGRT